MNHAESAAAWKLLARERVTIRDACSLLVTIACGCSVAGPRFADSAPDPVPPLVCRGAVADVRLYGDTGLGYERAPDGPDPIGYAEVTPSAAVGVSSDGDEVSTSVEHSLTFATGPYPDLSFVPRLPRRDEDDGDGDGPIGFLRTHDRIVAPAVYATFTHGERSPAAPALDLLLTELRERALAVGADEVDRVRCFGRNARRSLRVWCEAELHLSARRIAACPRHASLTTR